LKNPDSLSRTFAASANRRFEFKESRQLFIGMRNQTLSVVAMCASNEIVRPLQSTAEIVSDDRRIETKCFCTGDTGLPLLMERAE
jgi:hypothetical protein